MKIDQLVDYIIDICKKNKLNYNKIKRGDNYVRERIQGYKV